MVYSIPHLVVLSFLSGRLRYENRRNEALLVIQPVVKQYQQLAATNPAAFNADLAQSLNNYSNHLSDMGHQKEALAAIQQAVELYKQLAITNPAAFNADLAQSLNNYSVCLSDMGHQEEALGAIQQAVELYNKLSAKYPGNFNSVLQESIKQLSGFHQVTLWLGLNGLWPQELKEYSVSYSTSDYLGPVLESKCLVTQTMGDYLGLGPLEETTEKMFQVATRTFNLLDCFPFYVYS
jgi:tetratricopeptide (TPR) repeat protein